ncbi:MAG: 2'-5' RNA ligase family protein [Clostridia bacterium]|nr:2'-5' RNA ligase family protein [Clostridia bacterium]
MICVMAKLPPDAEERLDLLRKTVLSGEQCVKPLHGHITIVTYLGDNRAQFIQDCAEILRETPSFRVRYEKLEVLPETSILVATPSKPDTLMTLHRKMKDRYSKSLDRWTCGADWYPHTTLLYDPKADLAGLCRQMQDVFTPFETCIRQAEFSEVKETGYTILGTIHLMESEDRTAAEEDSHTG